MVAVAIVLGAGRGERMGLGRPKALVRVAGRTLLDWSIAALALAPDVRAVLPVLPPGLEALPGEIATAGSGSARILDPVSGGATRQESVARGVRAIERETPDADWVLVHDAARCLVLPGDAERVLACARETGAAIPVLAVSDTLKEVEIDRVVRTLDRSRIAATQTPQAFRLALLREALDKAARDGFVGTDCASLVERLGATVRTCPGRPENFKVTRPEDLARAAILLEGRSGCSGGKA